MAEEEVLETKPENLSGRECMEFSMNPQLKKRYEDKWGQGITDLCDTEK